MAKPINIASTAHAQHAELQQLMGSKPAKGTSSDQAGRVEELETALSAANDHLEKLTAELEAERAAHMQLIAELHAAIAEATDGAIQATTIAALLPALSE